MLVFLDDLTVGLTNVILLIASEKCRKANLRVAGFSATSSVVTSLRSPRARKVLSECDYRWFHCWCGHAELQAQAV
jgi:hypothetical protein